MTWITRLLTVALGLLPGVLAGAPSSHLETIYAEGKVDVFAQPTRKDTQKLGPKSGRRAIARGDIVASGPGGRVAVGIGGHTVVKASPDSVFSVLPASVEARTGRRVEVIFVFLGEVKATTNWSRAPKGLRVKISSENQSYSTDLGAVSLRAVAPGGEGVTGFKVNLEKALELSAKALPFTEPLHAPNPPPERVAELRAKMAQKQAAKKKTGGARKKRDR